MRLWKLQTYILVILLTTIVVFAFYNTRSFRTGPVITVTSPSPYQQVPTVVRVSGSINKPQEATINGATLLVTKNGDFTTTVIVTPPIDTIDIWAKNMYNKESRLSIPVHVVE